MEATVTHLPTAGKFAKFWPFRVGMSLLYTDHKSLERLSDTRILIDTGNFAAFLGIDAQKLHGYLNDLHDLMILEDLSIRHGHCLVTVNVPKQWENLLPAPEIAEELD